MKLYLVRYVYPENYGRDIVKRELVGIFKNRTRAREEIERQEKRIGAALLSGAYEITTVERLPWFA